MAQDFQRQHGHPVELVVRVGQRRPLAGPEDERLVAARRRATNVLQQGGRLRQPVLVPARGEVLGGAPQPAHGLGVILGALVQGQPPPGRGLGGPQLGDAVAGGLGGRHGDLHRDDHQAELVGHRARRVRPQRLHAEVVVLRPAGADEPARVLQRARPRRARVLCEEQEDEDGGESLERGHGRLICFSVRLELYITRV